MPWMLVGGEAKPRLCSPNEELEEKRPGQSSPVSQSSTSEGRRGSGLLFLLRKTSKIMSPMGNGKKTSPFCKRALILVNIIWVLNEVIWH